MDELKVLVGMLDDLPALALWIIAMFFAYKVICIGSLYGLIKFAIEKIHLWMTSERIVKYDIGGNVLTSCMPNLVSQISRIRNKGNNTNSQYINSEDVNWLSQAIDLKEEKDREAKK